MFCPECGSILMPRTVRGKQVIGCSCGYVEKDKNTIELEEKSKTKLDVDVVENEEQEEVNPIAKEECPKCGNKEARYWLVQMRAADEPETQFFKCTKCKHTWRKYD